MNRIGIFVDVNNIISAKNSRLIVDKIIPTIENLEGGVVTSALFYVGIAGDLQTRNFLHMMTSLAQSSGFRTEICNEKIFSDGTRKANLDVNLVVDAIALMDRYDTCAIMSGDGDFAYLASHLQAHGKRVVVISHESQTASQAINQCDKFYNEHTFPAIKTNVKVSVPTQPVSAIVGFEKSTNQQWFVDDGELEPGKIVRPMIQVASTESNPLIGLECVRRADETVEALVIRAFYELTGNRSTKKVKRCTLVPLHDKKFWLHDDVYFEVFRQGMKVTKLRLKA